MGFPSACLAYLRRAIAGAVFLLDWEGKLQMLRCTVLGRADINPIPTT